jgi:outer membrane protein OmpA-like peptidoglycan-associated protein
MIAFPLSITFGQIDLLNKIKEKAEDKIEKKIDDELDKGDKKKEETKKEESQEKESTNIEKQETTVKKNVNNDLKAYSKYDFIPGDKTLFFEDFSQDNVSDFPARWNTNTGGEVVTLNNEQGKWLRMKINSCYVPEFVDKLPDNCTIEFDAIVAHTNGNEVPSFCFRMIASKEGDRIDDLVPGHYGGAFNLHQYSIEAFNWNNGEYGQVSSNVDNELFKNNLDKKVRVSIWIQKQRVRLYLNESKVYDIPRMMDKDNRLNTIRFQTDNCDDKDANIFISNIRIAEGAPDMRSKLITEGKLVTHGILFDSGKDKVKPESYGTLKEIAGVLKENANVKIKIVGHTDSDGSDASNLDLSKRRAAAVKDALKKDFGIDENRMQTDGKGESEPISPNDTLEGKANNRRVELLKL